MSETARARRREIEVAGLRSPVLEAGPPDAREGVVFLHGNPGSSMDWEEMVPRVGAFARAVAIDVPGFGKADKPRDFPHSVHGHADHLERTLDVLGIDRVHLVMHDFGGGWGLQWAARHLDRVGSLTLIDIGILPGYRGHLLAILWRIPLVGELVQRLAVPSLMRRVMRRRRGGKIPQRHIDRMIEDFDAGTKRTVLRLYRSARGSDLGRRLGHRLSEFRGPVLVLWGRSDPYVSAAYAERQREVWPHAQVHVLEASGHWPMLDDPAATAELLVPFLEKHFARQHQ